MKTFIVAFDNLVTDDGPILQMITAENLGDCYQQAYILSKRSGFSEGNFDIYINEFDSASLKEAADDLLIAE